MRGRIIALVVGGAVLGGVAAGCSSGPRYDGVCEDTSTQLRTNDSNCQQQGQGSGTAQFIWVYYAAGQTIPRIGNFLDNAIQTPPSGADLANGGVPTDGTNADPQAQDDGGGGAVSGGGATTEDTNAHGGGRSGGSDEGDDEGGGDDGGGISVHGDGGE